MLAEWVNRNLVVMQDPAKIVLIFFLYSHMGYLLECVVLTAEQKKLVINRGFVRHLPFCIIYGFGALLGYTLLSPLVNDPVALFLVGALCATTLEFFTAHLQIRIFGDFWWDYSNKFMNYRGILCLESTIGWGFAALVIVKYMHTMVVGVTGLIPQRFTAPLAAVLVTAYAVDFLLSVRYARREKEEQQRMPYFEELEEARSNKF